MEILNDPGILALVGGDRGMAEQLVNIVTHVFDTIWRKQQRSSPESPEPKTTLGDAPETPDGGTGVPSPVTPRQDKTRRARRDTLLALVGGDPQRLEELVETVARLWWAHCRQRPVPG